MNRLPPAIPTEMLMRRIGLTMVLALSLALVPIAGEAQQATKVTTIGYLSGSSLSANGARIEAFRMGLRELGHVEAKTSPLSGDLSTENSIASQRLRPN